MNRIHIYFQKYLCELCGHYLKAQGFMGFEKVYTMAYTTNLLYKKLNICMKVVMKISRHSAFSKNKDFLPVVWNISWKNKQNKTFSKSNQQFVFIKSWKF